MARRCVVSVFRRFKHIQTSCLQAYHLFTLDRVIIAVVKQVSSRLTRVNYPNYNNRACRCRPSWVITNARSCGTCCNDHGVRTRLRPMIPSATEERPSNTLDQMITCIGSIGYVAMLNILWRQYGGLRQNAIGWGRKEGFRTTTWCGRSQCRGRQVARWTLAGVYGDIRNGASDRVDTCRASKTITIFASVCNETTVGLFSS